MMLEGDSQQQVAQQKGFEHLKDSRFSPEDELRNSLEHPRRSL